MTFGLSDYTKYINMKKNKRCRVKLWFDRLLSKSLWRQFLILAVLLVAALGLSYMMLSWSGAEWGDFCDRKNLNKWLLPLYLMIDSNALNNLYIGDTGQGNAVHGWMLAASSIIFLFGAFVFNGIIIGIITSSIGQRIENHRQGRIHYLKSGHYVIMGYDEIVPSIISHIFDKDNEAFVLVLTSEDVAVIREKLSRSFSEEDMKRIILNFGHRVSAGSYRDICLEGAGEVYVVGNHSNSAHDAVNVECMDSICRYLGRPDIKTHPERITCFFNDLDTYSAFKTSEIFTAVRELGMEFVPYNFFIGWAKQVFVKREYRDFDNPGVTYRYPCLYGKGITPDDDRYVHLVFVGTSDFAVAFAMEAAHVLHFPNSGKAKTRITFIDRNADKEKDEFIIRNRHFFEVQSYVYRDLSDDAAPGKADKHGSEYVLFSKEDADFLDVEFEFIKGDVFSHKVQNEIRSWAGEHNGRQYLSIFLALSDQRCNFLMGMNMPDEVYDNGVNVFIRQGRSDNFVTNLRNADLKNEEDRLVYSAVGGDYELNQEKRNARYANIYPFGMNETAYWADDLSLRRAKLLNYLYSTADYGNYRFQSIETLNTLPEAQIWADAEKYWRKLSVALKWSNLYSAYALRTKIETLRAIRGLDISDPSHDYDLLSEYETEVLARLEHNRWNLEKLLMGYRKARPHEDKYVHKEYAGKLAGNKKLFIHHDIRPYDKLKGIEELDKEFSRYIPWLLNMTND